MAADSESSGGLFKNIRSLPGRFVTEIGILSIIESPLDTKLLCLQRFVRLFAYGAIALILVLYLSALGIEDKHIGLFMTLTLLGDVVISFFLTLFADGLGRKNTLMLGAAMMIFSGLVFATSASYWILVGASIIGVISPSGMEIGPFRAIEESTLAHLSPKDRRSDVFAWYQLIGTTGAALGQLSCGWAVDKLKTRHGWTIVDALRTMFFAYAVLGAIKFFLAMMLSKKSEREAPQETPTAVAAEARPLLADQPNTEDANYGTSSSTPDDASPAKSPSKFRALLPSISPESVSIVIKICILFAFDSFASGLVTPSWISYFFTRKFGVAEGVLGTLFFVTSIISAASNLVAASIARRIGPIKTMVFTHLPSAIALALIPAPNQVGFAMLFLVLRSCTSNMDTAPRQAFLAAAVLPSERTAVMGVVNVVKILAQSGGPSVTGALAGSGKFWVTFLLAGCLKASYDLSILAMFAGFKGREEEGAAPKPVHDAEGSDAAVAEEASAEETRAR